MHFREYLHRIFSVFSENIVPISTYITLFHGNWATHMLSGNYFLLTQINILTHDHPLFTFSLTKSKCKLTKRVILCKQMYFSTL